MFTYFVYVLVFSFFQLFIVRKRSLVLYLTASGWSRCKKHVQYARVQYRSVDKLLNSLSCIRKAITALSRPLIVMTGVSTCVLLPY